MGCSMHKPQVIDGGVGLQRKHRAIGKLIFCAVLALVAVLIQLALRIRRHIGAIA